MFKAECKDIELVLKDYNVSLKIQKISELQRYHYEQKVPDSKEVRLIVKIDLENASALVIRFKNEKDVTLELVENQCRFADTLYKNNILTPHQYRAKGRFANRYCIGGYDVIVTIEDFVENEVTIVDESIAEKTGALLAKMHNVSEQNMLQLESDVLFDPFDHNDLFAYDSFLSLEKFLNGENKKLFEKIKDKYEEYMIKLSPLRRQMKYAVQGDMSECNLYLTDGGTLGVFDYNRAGDNRLFCDAVMQAVFVARLMDYPDEKETEFEAVLLKAFWKGYCSVRNISKEEEGWYPYLYAIIDAFWSADIRWNDDSLMNACCANECARIYKWLTIVWSRIISLVQMPV